MAQAQYEVALLSLPLKKQVSSLPWLGPGTTGTNPFYDLKNSVSLDTHRNITNNNVHCYGHRGGEKYSQIFKGMLGWIERDKSCKLEELNVLHPVRWHSLLTS